MANSQPSRPSYRRIALVGFALPAAIVLVDRFTWISGGSLRGGHSMGMVFFPWLAVKAALLSWCAGRFLGATLYGWIIFLWCQVLLDVQTFGASQGVFGYELGSLSHTLISAQTGFLIVWTFVGATTLPWRLTSFLAAITAIIVQARSMDTNYLDVQLPLVQWLAAIIVAVLCGALRFSGFRLALSAPDAGQSGSGPTDGFHFGIKHMLAWTTALAPLLVVLKGIDDLPLDIFSAGDIYPAAVICVCISLVTLAAIWLALGTGPIATRIAAAALIIGATGWVLHELAVQWTPATFNWSSNADRLKRLVAEMGSLWWTWLGLLGALLAAMLLFLRAAGFRLAKVRKAAPTLATAAGAS